MHLRRIAVAALAVVLSGCDGGSGAAVTAPTVGPPSAPATVWIAQPGDGHVPMFVGRACFVGAHITCSFHIGIIAVRTVDVDHVTIAMIDGTHLGGPSVTFPGATVARQFGTVRVIAGTTRTFTVQPDFVCGRTSWHAVSAAIVFRDLQGARHTVTANLPLP